jgi:PAS domain-containing protein
MLRLGRRSSRATANVAMLGVIGLVAVRVLLAYEQRAARAERLVRESDSRLSQVLDNTSAVIYLRDCDGRYLLVNRQYEELFAVRRQDVIGLTDHELFPAEMADAFRANDLKAMESDVAIQMEEVA